MLGGGSSLLPAHAQRLGPPCPARERLPQRLGAAAAAAAAARCPLTWWQMSVPPASQVKCAGEVRRWEMRVTKAPAAHWNTRGVS